MLAIFAIYSFGCPRKRFGRKYLSGFLHPHKNGGVHRFPFLFDKNKTLVTIPNLTMTVMTGPVKGRAVSIAPGQVVQAGRTKTADLHVMDPAMSRLHFELRWNGSNWIVRDLDSHNGTFIDSKKIQTRVVKHGDSIVAGDTSFNISFLKNSDAGSPHFPSSERSEYNSHHKTIDADSGF